MNSDSFKKLSGSHLSQEVALIKVKVVLVLSYFNRVRLFETPWTVAHQAPLSMEFSRQEYWNGLPFPSPFAPVIIISTIYLRVCSVTQSCPTLCYPMDCSLPGCSIHRIFQAKIPVWVAISFSRGQTPVSCTAGRFFTS